MTGLASTADIPQLKRNFKTVFGDTDDYIHLFFDYKFAPERTIVYRHGSVLAGGLYYILHTLKRGDELFNCAYICGVHTLSEFRGQGIMAQMMAYTHQYLRGNGVHYCALIPAEAGLFDLYARHGYETAFYLQREELAVSGIKPAPSGLRMHTVSGENDIYTYYKKAVARLDCAVLQSRADMRVVLRDLANACGVAYVFKDGNDVAGYFFAVMKHGDLCILEWFCEEEHGAAALSLVRSRFAMCGIVKMQTNVTDEARAIPFGMLLALDGRQPGIVEKRAYMNMMLN